MATLLCTKCDASKPSSAFSKSQQKKAKRQAGKGVLCMQCVDDAAAASVENENEDGSILKDTGTTTANNNMKKKTSSFSSGGLNDECAYCMNRGRLLMQCRHCHSVRYCDKACMDAHWTEGHAMICKPIIEEAAATAAVESSLREEDEKEDEDDEVLESGGGGGGGASDETHHQQKQQHSRDPSFLSPPPPARRQNQSNCDRTTPNSERPLLNTPKKWHLFVRLCSSCGLSCRWLY